MAVSAKLLKNRSGQRASNPIYPCLNGDKYLIYDSRNRQYESDIQPIASGAPVGAGSAEEAMWAGMPGASSLLATAWRPPGNGIDLSHRQGKGVPEIIFDNFWHRYQHDQY